MASNIRYLSTRGESTGASYDEIVLRGLASDGGLFMPESYPQVTLLMSPGRKSGERALIF